jgi:ribosomal protein L11 methyltransferase
MTRRSPAAASPAAWLRLRLQVPEEAAEAVGVACIDLGAPGVVTGQRDLRRAPGGTSSGRPARTRIEAYFPRGRSSRPLEARLRTALEGLRGAFPGIDPSAIRLESFAARTSRSAARGHFPALAVGRTLFICTPWTPKREIARARRAGRRALVIEPGQAFGTGHHPTTRGCLVAIERACIGHPPRRALDLGCGSGILAIAMAQLGARRVVAVDVDPLARAATAAAASVNEISTIRVAPGLGSARGRFDLVVANLFSELLIEMAPALVGRLAPQGTLVVAGLLDAQEAGVRAAFAACGLAVLRRTARSTWVVLELTAAGRRGGGPIAAPFRRR